jgi:hypothetical protein
MPNTCALPPFFTIAGQLESEDLEDALRGFQQVLTMEEEKGEW